jgi:hypothetical protein
LEPRGGPHKHVVIGGGTGGRSLPPGRRALLEQVIVAELRRAWDAAVATGASPESLAHIVENRRRAIESSAGPAEDVQHGDDDPLDSGPIRD